MMRYARLAFVAIWLLLVVSACPPAAAGELIASYDAGQGPTAWSPGVWGWQAWDVFGTEGRSVSDPSAGGPAWQVADRAGDRRGPRYLQGLPVHLLGRVDSEGWRLSAELRIVDPGGTPSMGFSVYHDRKAYLVTLGRSPQSGWLEASLFDTQQGLSIVRPLAPPSQLNDYHDFDLTWSPATGLASLFFGGQLIASWDGVPSTHSAVENNFQFGATTPFGNGTMNVRSVEFAIADPPGLPGDYNGDGAVDAADFTVWRDNLGTAFAGADGNSDGIVNTADYQVWRNNLGRRAGAATAAVAAPEPSAAAVLTLAAVACGLRSRGGWPACLAV
ncbi:MAG: hypothetical protein AAGJ46_03640 [Planctomycetota bacterium]